MPTICLNMIVKNESKIITRLFDSVIDIIDTYVICDTGSTDDTIHIINSYFNNVFAFLQHFSPPRCQKQQVRVNGAMVMMMMVV